MQQKTYQCRFGLFVKLKPGVLTHLPGQKRTWYYNGNRFTDDEKKGFRNLISHQLNKSHLYAITELYDNQFPTEEPDRLVLKIVESIVQGQAVRTVEKNNLAQYRDLLTGYPLPHFLK